MQFRGAISVASRCLLRRDAHLDDGATFDANDQWQSTHIISGNQRTLMSAPPSTHRLPMLSHSRSTKAPRLPATLLNGSCSDGIKVVGACAGPGFTWSVKGEPGRLADC